MVLTYLHLRILKFPLIISPIISHTARYFLRSCYNGIVLLDAIGCYWMVLDGIEMGRWSIWVLGFSICLCLMVNRWMRFSRFFASSTTWWEGGSFEGDYSLIMHGNWDEFDGDFSWSTVLLLSSTVEVFTVSSLEGEDGKSKISGSWRFRLSTENQFSLRETHL